MTRVFEGTAQPVDQPGTHKSYSQGVPKAWQPGGRPSQTVENQSQEGSQAHEPHLGCNAEPDIVGIGVVKGPAAGRPVADINGRGPRTCACDGMRRPVLERSFPRQNATRLF